MNCAICGKDNQPGTRFCVHCGASLAAAAPAPAAGAAGPRAAAAGTGSVAAANATTAASRQGAGSAAEPTVIRKAATVAAAPIPAYDAQPRKGGGRILVIIGIAALVIAGGYIGYKIFGGSTEVKDSLAKFETPAPARVEPPVQSPPPPAAETSPPPQPAEAPKPADDKPSVAKDGEAASPAKAAEAPKSVSPGAPKVDGKTDGKAAAKSPPAGASAPAAAPSPSPRPAAPAAPVVVPPPAAAPVQDRWAKFDEELLECKKESLFNRIVCDQKVRLRYCNGYWGKVAQCPGNPTNADKGQ